jgi:quinone-modifying oxidoreductase subunit QmoB
VVTNANSKPLPRPAKSARPSDGKEAKSVVFIQSPDKDENDTDFSNTPVR